CKVRLCPDMAFCLDNIANHQLPQHNLLLLMRTDHEKLNDAPLDLRLPASTLFADWVRDKAGMQERVRRKTIQQLLPALGLKALSPFRRRELLYRRLAEARVARGLRLLSSVKFVITDRLHAHILCTLLNLPHTILDNCYGKLSSFADVWTKE